MDITGLEPQVIMTDIDPVMNVACQRIYKNRYHIYYIWHMSQNLPKRLKNKLKIADFKTFIKDF